MAGVAALYQTALRFVERCDAPDARTASYDGGGIWHDPGNGQFAKPGWSTAKGLALQLVDKVDDMAREHVRNKSKGAYLTARDSHLRGIGVPQGSSARVRFLNEKYGLIDVAHNGEVRPFLVPWERFSDDIPDEFATNGVVNPEFTGMMNRPNELRVGLVNRLAMNDGKGFVEVVNNDLNRYGIERGTVLEATLRDDGSVTIAGPDGRQFRVPPKILEPSAAPTPDVPATPDAPVPPAVPDAPSTPDVAPEPAQRPLNDAAQKILDDWRRNAGYEHLLTPAQDQEERDMAERLARRQKGNMLVGGGPADRRARSDFLARVRLGLGDQAKPIADAPATPAPAVPDVPDVPGTPAPAVPDVPAPDVPDVPAPPPAPEPPAPPVIEPLDHEPVPGEMFVGDQVIAVPDGTRVTASIIPDEKPMAFVKQADGLHRVNQFGEEDPAGHPPIPLMEYMASDAPALTAKQQDIAELAAEHGLAAEDIAAALDDLPDIRKELRDKARSLQYDAAGQLDRADAMNLARPPAKTPKRQLDGSTKWSRGTGGEWDWFDQLAKPEQERLRQNWMVDVNTSAASAASYEPDQLQQRLAEAGVGGDVSDIDSAMAYWLRQTQVIDGLRSVATGRDPARNGLGADDLGIELDEGIQPSDVLGRNRFDAAVAVAGRRDAHLSEYQQAEMDEASQQLTNSYRAPEGQRPWEMGFDAWNAEVTDLTDKLSAKLADDNAPGDIDTMVERYDQLLPLDVGDQDPQDMYDEIVSMAHYAGEKAYGDPGFVAPEPAAPDTTPVPDTPTAPDVPDVPAAATSEPFRSKMEATFYNDAERDAEIAAFDALPPDAPVVVYHGTTADRADNIQATGTVAADARGDSVSGVTQSDGLYVAPTYIDAERYAGKGGKVVEMVVPKSAIEPSPEAGDKSAGSALYHSFVGAVIPAGTNVDVLDVKNDRSVPDVPDTPAAPASPDVPDAPATPPTPVTAALSNARAIGLTPGNMFAGTENTFADLAAKSDAMDPAMSQKERDAAVLATIQLTEQERAQLNAVRDLGKAVVDDVEAKLADTPEHAAAEAARAAEAEAVAYAADRDAKIGEYADSVMAERGGTFVRVGDDWKKSREYAMPDGSTVTVNNSGSQLNIDDGTTRTVLDQNGSEVAIPNDEQVPLPDTIPEYQSTGASWSARVKAAAAEQEVRNRLLVEAIGGSPDNRLPIDNANAVPSEIQDDLDVVARYIPTSLLDRTPPVSVTKMEEGRMRAAYLPKAEPSVGGYLEARDAQLVIIPDNAPDAQTPGSLGTRSTFLHEFGHHLEQTNDDLSRADWAFLVDRLDLSGEANSYGDKATNELGIGEQTRNGGFKNAYTGKQYHRFFARDGKSFESFTTGLEAVFYPRMGQRPEDTDHESFILGLLKLLGSPLSDVDEGTVFTVNGIKVEKTAGGLIDQATGQPLTPEQMAMIGA